MLDRKLYQIIVESLGEIYFNEYPDNFFTRIIVQKVLYLLTHGHKNPKISIPYDWNFYIRGPYSSEIAHMVYHLNNFKANIKDIKVELNSDEQESITHFNKFKTDFDKLIQKYEDILKIGDADFYELIATLTYIGLQLGTDKKKIIEKFKRFKPTLSEKLNDYQFNEFIEILTNNNYI